MTIRYKLLIRKYKERLKSHLNSPMTNKFQRIAQIIAIIGTFISIYFAFITYQLTIKYGENREQINRLDTLATKQQIQIDTLVDILKELRIQNFFSREENIELKSQGIQIFEQTGLILDQLSLSREQQITANHFNKLNYNSNKNIFRSTFYSIGDQHDLLFANINDIDKVTNSQKLEFLSNIRGLIEPQLKNPYLLEDDTLQIKWIKMLGSISSCERILRQSDTTSIQVVDGNSPIHLADQNYLANYKLQWFRIFQSKYHDFYFSTLTKLQRDKELIYQKVIKK